jgi:hypothetical protein
VAKSDASADAAATSDTAADKPDEEAKA